MTRTPDPGAGDWAATLAATEAELREREAVTRLFSHDHTLWQDDPTEVANRLGWLDEPKRMQGEVDTLLAFVRDLERDHLDHVVWCGMGGSSLFPELLAATLDAGKVQPRPGPSFTVLDSSHPAAVARVVETVPLDRTLFCFASKSGGTIETRSHLEYFRTLVKGPSQLAVVTDAGSTLDQTARADGFRAVFNANPDIGGRYSALSHFGMVPAAILGLDLASILRGAVQMVEASREEGSPGFALAAAIGAGVRAGHDKLTIDAWGPFGDWVEQLVAESTGKHGTGILPVVREPLTTPDRYGADRLFAAYGPEHGQSNALLAPLFDLGSAAIDGGGGGLGGEVVRWEIAIALAGALLGVNPFDQPDVEAAKRAAADVLDTGVPELPIATVSDALATVEAGDYVAIQAFVDPASPNLEHFQSARVAIRTQLNVATTLAVGPRYLHSTGQLHKGGPPSGVFLQILDAGDGDVAVPGRAFTFGDLIGAQAAGDYAALQARNRRVFRVRAYDLAAYGV